MSEDETKELYTNTDTAVFERMTIPEKIGEQRAHSKRNFSIIEKHDKVISKMKEDAAIKAKLDTERHNTTTKSIDASEVAITKLTGAIQQQKDDDALEETNSLKAKIAKYESGAEKKTTESRKLLYSVGVAVAVIILTRHLGDIVKMLSGG